MDEGEWMWEWEWEWEWVWGWDCETMSDEWLACLLLLIRLVGLGLGLVGSAAIISLREAVCWKFLCLFLVSGL